MSHSYLEMIAVLERLHRRCLEVVKTELDRSGFRDINNIQALILFNIGDGELTVGELTLRGCYHGSNVSYNLKKLRDYGYVDHTQSSHDRRSFRVKLTPKGSEIRELLQGMFDRHSDLLDSLDIDEDMLTETNTTLLRLDRFWSASSSEYADYRTDERTNNMYDIGMRMRV